MPQPVYVIGALLGFGFIIFIHELGHFVAAKLFKVKVKAFSLGFPPTALHRQIGETDYRLGVIPLGGYVSMLGEDPEEVEAGDPLTNIAPGKRAVIFLAGVVMNVLSALAIYTVVSLIGMEMTSPIVGGVIDPSPAKAAGLRPGERIVRIDGQTVHSFSDIQMLVTLGAIADPKHRFEVELEGRAEPVLIASTRGNGILPMLGIVPPIEPVIDEIEPDSPAAMAGLEPGDRITAVAGRPVRFMNDAYEYLERVPKEPFTITVQRQTSTVSLGGAAPAPKGRPVELKVDPQAIRVPDYGLTPLSQVRKVFEDSAAAEAGLAEGDYIRRIGDVDYPEAGEVIDAIQAGRGKPLAMEVWRDGKMLSLEVTPKLDKLLGYYLIGVTFDPSDDPPVVRRLGKPSAAIDDAGIPDGSRIVSLNDTKTKSWRRLLERLDEAKDKAVTVGYQPPDSDETRTAAVTPRRVPPLYFFEGVTPDALVKEDLAAIRNPVSALGYGLTKIWRAMRLQYVSIRAMAGGQVSTDELSGPVRIGVGFYETAKAGWGRFLSFLAIISVIIALLNAMPLPPLDGGHVMFLALEKLRGKPVPAKVRSVITAIGAIALLSLVALAFFNDGRWILDEIFY